jgi:small subunit ribosomal protein S16
MSVKIRLTRIGRTHSPIYRIVATDSRSPRDGRFIEILGTYNPIKKEIVQFHSDRVEDWISKGALPSDSVKKIIKRYKDGAAKQSEDRAA